VIHRVDLHRVLLDACEAEPNVELMPLTGAAAYEDTGNGVRLRITDGRTIEGAAVIGADGLRSAIRQQMLDEGEPRTIGYVAHRTIVPMADVKFEVDRDDAVLWSDTAFTLCNTAPQSHAFNIVTVFKTSNDAALSATRARIPT
jgi:salicylate hydroxylase